MQYRNNTLFYLGVKELKPDCNQHNTKMPKGRVCVIGAGPAGVSALYQYAMLGSGEKPEVTCYEKQDSWGGMWNYTWRTGKII